VRNQKGLALITVIVAFAIVLLAVGAVILISRTESSTVINNQQAEVAFQLAESGIDWGAAKVRANPDFSTTTTIIAQTPSYVVKVSVTNDPQTKTATIISYSIVSGSSVTPTGSRAIQASFEITKKQIVTAGSLFKRAITCNGRIDGGVNSKIKVSTPLPNEDGISILSNYNDSGNAVYFKQHLDLDGKIGVMDGASYDVPDPSKVTVTASDPVKPLTEYEINAWKEAATKEGHYYSGDQDWGNGKEFDGIYFIDGNLEVGNKLSGKGTLVVNGDLITKNKTEIAAEPFALIVLGNAQDLNLKNNAHIGGYIYCEGDISFKNNLILVGGISAIGSVEFKNGADITYTNLGSSEEMLPSGFSTEYGVLETIFWKEVLPPASP